MSKTAIFIPARMASTRLPGKPLANINGKPMIVHVLERALESGIKDVFVACSEVEVKETVEKYNGIAILTNPDIPSGTDRIFEALKSLGRDYNYIINVQGDLPTLNPDIINIALSTIKKYRNADIVTLATVITDEKEKTNPNVVKAVVSMRNNNVGKALYFTRATAPYGDGKLLHHIGLYVYRKKALEKFVSLPLSSLEKQESLEQLRALENDLNIYVALVDTVPFGVDTQEDLEKARDMYRAKA